MKYICLSVVLCLLAGCGEKDARESEMDPNQQIMEKLGDAQRLVEDKDLTTKLTNQNTVTVEDALELRDRCDEIMEIMGSGDIKGAVEEMKKYSFLPDSEMDGLYAATVKQMDLLKNRYGELIGYEFVFQQLVSESLVRFIYLAKCENHPCVWYFMFYKAKDKWTLNYIYWNDQIQNIP